MTYKKDVLCFDKLLIYCFHFLVRNVFRPTTTATCRNDTESSLSHKLFSRVFWTIFLPSKHSQSLRSRLRFIFGSSQENPLSFQAISPSSFLPVESCKVSCKFLSG
ncbi:hypothetical protein GmHk_10G030069 [Glycine max]|nr:hypothetical protein GmHk_10G030069 [Glycine max]KAH1230679.1 hypothetical protein GmHk_10G030069 [Glycine max]